MLFITCVSKSLQVFMASDGSLKSCSLIIASILRVNKSGSCECWTWKGGRKCVYYTENQMICYRVLLSVVWNTVRRNVCRAWVVRFSGTSWGGGEILVGVGRPIVLHGVKTQKTSIILWIHLAWVSGFRFLRPPNWTGFACEFSDPHTFKSEERDVSVCVCLSIHPAHSVNVCDVCRCTFVSKINPFYCSLTCTLPYTH